MTSYLLYGAGAVGGVIGARLHLAGHEVTLVARGAHLARIRADGLVLDTVVVCAQNGEANEPATLRRFARATVLPDEAADLRPLVRAEAEAAVTAAGIAMVSHEADAERRGDLLQGRADVDGPNSLGPNSLGQSLARQLDTEVDYRAGEVVLLGRLHGVATPANERIQRAARRK
jgi:ketopantoate reductase